MKCPVCNQEMGFVSCDEDDSIPVSLLEIDTNLIGKLAFRHVFTIGQLKRAIQSGDIKRFSGIGRVTIRRIEIALQEWREQVR